MLLLSSKTAISHPSEGVLSTLAWHWPGSAPAREQRVRGRFLTVFLVYPPCSLSVAFSDLIPSLGCSLKCAGPSFCSLRSHLILLRQPTDCLLGHRWQLSTWDFVSWLLWVGASVSWILIIFLLGLLTDPFLRMVAWDISCVLVSLNISLFGLYTSLVVWLHRILGFFPTSELWRYSPSFLRCHIRSSLLACLKDGLGWRLFTHLFSNS